MVRKVTYMTLDLQNKIYTPNNPSTCTGIINEKNANVNFKSTPEITCFVTPRKNITAT